MKGFYILGISIFLTFSFLFFSCYQEQEKKITKKVKKVEKFKHKYLLVNRNGTIDTIKRKLLKNYYKNYIYYISYLKESKSYDGTKKVFKKEYKFPSNKVSDSLEFFKKDIEEVMTLEDSIFLNYKEETYKIYKYFYDDLGSYDEEILQFFNRKFGVLINKSAAWGSYDRLISNGNKKELPIIFYLCERIISSREFHIE